MSWLKKREKEEKGERKKQTNKKTASLPNYWGIKRINTHRYWKIINCGVVTAIGLALITLQPVELYSYVFFWGFSWVPKKFQYMLSIHKGPSYILLKSTCSCLEILICISFIWLTLCLFYNQDWTINQKAFKKHNLFNQTCPTLWLYFNM